MDQVLEILDYVLNIPYQYDLFFTVSTDNHKDLINSLKSRHIEKYKIHDYPNQGYDIAPFLHLLPLLSKENYQLICKIHTKKGPSHQTIFKHWFKHLMQPILGSKQTVENIIDSFDQNKQLGIIGSADFYKSAQGLMYGNEKPVEELLSVIDSGFDVNSEWGFFAGTIFWARVDLFNPLLNNPKLDSLVEKSSKVEMESGTPVSIFHALERVIGALPYIKNMTTGVSNPIDKTRTTFSVQVLPHSFIPSSDSIQGTLKKIQSSHNQKSDTH